MAQPLVQASLVGEAIDGGPALVFVADEDGRYVAANQYACDALGYTREELLALSVTDVAKAPGTADAYREFVSERTRRGRVELTRKDGTTFAIEYRAQNAAVAGLTVYVSVGWPLDDASGTPAPRRRSARARG